MKNLIRFFLFLLCILALAYFVPSHLNLNHKKKAINEIIKNSLIVDAEIKGEILFQILPIPKVFINQVQISKDGSSVEIYKVNVRTPLTSILGKGFEIDAIEIENTQFYEEDKPILQYLFSDKKSLSKVNFNSISLKNIEYVDNSLDLGRITGINGDLSVIDNGKENKEYSFKGGLSLNGVSYLLDSKIITGKGSSIKKSTLNLDSNLLKLSFNGQISSLRPVELKGEIDIAFKGSDQSHPNLLISWLNRDKSTIKAVIEYNTARFMLEDIKINGSGLQNLSGKIEYDKEFGNILHSSVSIKKLDFDKHNTELSSNKLNSTDIKQKLRSFLTLIDFELPEKIDGDVKFSLEEIIFNKQSIKAIDLSAKIIEGKFLMPDLNLKLPANTNLTIKGSLSNNRIRTKFDGSLDLETNDLKAFLDWLNIKNDIAAGSSFQNFRLRSNLVAIPRNIRFENIRSLIGDVRVMGQLSLRATDNRNVGIKTALRFDKIDADSLGVPKAIHTLATNAFVFDYDRSGTKFVDSMGDFNFLRTFPLNLDAEIQVDSLTYRSQNILGFNSRFSIEPNKLKIDRLNFSSPNGSVFANLGFSVSGIRPELIGQIRLSRVNDSFMSYIFPSLETLKDTGEKFKEANAPKKNPENLQKSMVVDPLLFADFGNINFFSIDKFSGNIELIIDDYNSKDLKFDNLHATLVLNNGVIGVPSIMVNIFEGQFSAIGNIILVGNVPSVNASFQLNNFNPSSFTKYFYNATPIKGYMSLSGGISANGFKFADVIGRANGNITFAGKKITWVGFDIGEILKTAEQQISLAAKVDRFNYYTNNGETVFNDVDGVMTIGSGFATITNVKLANNRANGSFASNLSILNGAISSAAKLSFIPFGTQIPVTISINSKGLMSKQETKIEADQLINFFNQQSRISGSSIQDDQSQSLLRNRRL